MFLLLYVEFSVAHFKRRNSRGRAKMEKKQGKKGESISILMIRRNVSLKSMHPVTITVEKSIGGFRFDYAAYWVLTVKVVT